MSYTSLSAVKAELKLTATTDDMLIGGYVTLAQRIIEAQKPLGTGYVFEVASATTRYLDAPADASNTTLDGPLYVLLLPEPLCTISSVVNGDGETVTDYVTEPRWHTPYYALRLKSGLGITWNFDTSPEGAIAITGKWGYSETAPADISRAALRLCVWMYKERDSGWLDRDIQTDDGILLATRMPRDVRQIIESYWSLV